MLDLTQRTKDVWPDRWTPVNEGDINKESFDTWWSRHKKEFQHLHPQIVEQWIYRHWKNSPFKFLNPLALHWQKQTLTTKQFLDTIFVEFGIEGNSEHDFSVFNPNKPNALKTGLNWKNGSWTIPVIILKTPNGIVSYRGERPKVRNILIEGSKRYRWLKAQYHNNIATGPHQVFVLA